MAVSKDSKLEIQIFTRINRRTDEMLDELAERQAQNKSLILRKALEQYLQNNMINQDKGNNEKSIIRRKNKQ